MLTRSITNRQLSRYAAVVRCSARYFSGEAQTQSSEKPDIQKEFEEVTEADKKKYRDAWGLKFDDECIKFEKEWEKIAADRDHQQMAALKEELTEQQQRKVDFLADKILQLSIMETRFLAAQMKNRIQKSTGINPLKLNMDWPSIKMDSDGTWPPLNPNWFKQQELMSQITPFMGMGGGGFGGAPGGGAPAGQAQSEQAPAEEKKEEVKEKTNFDVELSGFDAKNKIKLIKELRAALNLGLKEAKEMVESAPVWLKKGMAKAEVDELVKQLDGLGAELKIV